MQFILDFILHASPLVIYLVVAIVLLLESCGVPITNNMLLLLTGALASLGHLNIWLLTLAAILGSTAGACLAYIIGAHGGRRVFLRLVAFFRIDESKIRMTESWFHKSGVWMIFLSRMTPYVRPFVCFLGGITHIPAGRFFTTALTGSMLWCVVMIQVGAMLGPHWEIALHLLKHYTLPTILALVLLLVLNCFIKYMIGHHRHLRQDGAVDVGHEGSEQSSANLQQV